MKNLTFGITTTNMIKIGVFSIFFLGISLVGFAQDRLTMEQKTEMVKRSSAVILTSEVINKVQDYATQNNYDIKILNKNQIHLQVIYNELLGVNQRVKYCDYLLSLWSYNKSSVPAPLIKEKKKLLLNQNKEAND